MAKDVMPTTGTRESGTARALVLAAHDRLAHRGWAAPVTLWDGTALGPADAPYRIKLNHPWSLRPLLRARNNRAIGEAYLHNGIDVEGSMVAALHDATAHRQLLTAGALVRLAPRGARLPHEPHPDGMRRARLRGRRHSLRRDSDAVRFHYDVGNDFYGLFLDERLVYSCAYFASPDETLDRAQLRKLDLICRKLHLQPDERFLDVGCGWGSLVIHAAQHYGVRALGVTLSERQAELARERIAEAGLADRAEIRLADYREVRETFDTIASVGMVEHVGADQLDGYFRHLWELTAPGGRLLNHGITTGRRQIVRDFSKDRDSFVGTYVFPDGALVPAATTAQAAEAAGFELLDLEQLRPHYARTLAHWVERLERNADQARAVAGEEVYRTWRAYMAGSAVGFEIGDLGVVQILGGRDARLPLTRAHHQPAEA